jgi:aminomethyltransferase
LEDRGIPRSHYEICDPEGLKIGEVTSGTQSPTLGKGVGMGYVKAEFSKEGSELFINIRGKLHRALVTARPFLKK